MKEIMVTSVKFGEKTILVDDEDFDNLSKHTWSVYQNAHGTFYSSTSVNGKKVKMHRMILGLADPRIFVDHKDHNGINNQRNNIRACSAGENCKNKTSRANSSSKYLGVSSYRGKWRTDVRVNRRTIWIGYYHDEVEAARAYDAAASRLHGEFANLNFKP